MEVGESGGINERSSLLSSSSSSSILPALMEKQEEAVREVILHGLPPESRQYIWKRLSGSIDLEMKYPNLYVELSRVPPPYKTLEAIQADIPRTFSFSEDHSESFMAQKGEELKVLLSTYANFDTKLQYAQGMNYLAGVLLLHLPLEEAFW
eukprot:CAMPEP_0201511424 /NCGR_PEP_ID=MMETSP0161_2-20130828/3890_1 /ASSEMBLY_ACC=CAM_ASM_000251 /TAXON_ID=180227 /ORGANISM="Neoparamoeba aestuarina, Strain SoJaBio B1-5/56/2" /LENGTH=150 /DNA_ID=CAMNT_0047906917 /DNA_START=269 /DNA_END=718 /DNA_ORIENTATION=+